MAYSAPTSRSTGDLITAAIWNQDLVNNLNAAFPLGVGAWTSWTPTLTNLTLGNGTVNAKYQRVGRIVFYRFRFTLGTTSAVGTAPEVSLPAAPSSDYNGATSWMGAAVLTETGASNHLGYAQHTATGFRINHQVVSGSTLVRGSVTATAPFTWGSTDVIEVDGFYEAAS